MATDRQFEVQSDFCRDVLIPQLREAVSDSEAFDVRLSVITKIEFLIQVYTAMHKDGIAAYFPHMMKFSPGKIDSKVSLMLPIILTLRLRRHLGFGLGMSNCFQTSTSCVTTISRPATRDFQPHRIHFRWGFLFAQ